MARRRRKESPEEAPPRGLYRRYRVVLRARVGEAGDAVALEVSARTQGAARRAATQKHPGYVVAELTRIE